MALRREDVVTAPDAVVVAFPVRVAAARRRRARRVLLRRRLAAVGVTLALVLGSVMLSAAGGQAAVVSRQGAPDSIVVEPGDTLWDVALRYAAEGSDRQAYVDRLIVLNDVSGVAPPGMRLDLP